MGGCIMNIIQIAILYSVFQYGVGNAALLSEACMVIDVLDPKVKRELMTWFVKLQLSEYLVLFSDSQDVSC